MTKKIGVGLFSVVLVIGLAACGKKKEGGDKGGGGGAPAEVSTADLCAKAKACIDSLAKADPASADTMASVGKAIDGTTDDAAKRNLCKQALEGGALNPKATAECK